MRQLLALALLFFSLPSHANLWGDLNLGYHKGSIEAKTVSDAVEDGDTSGLGVGIKGGFNFKGFLLGVDYTLTMGTYDIKDSDYSDPTWETSNISLLLGGEFGRFKVWACYGVSNEYTYKYDFGLLSFDATVMGGTAYRAGLGFRITDKFGVAAEYFVSEPDKIKVTGSSEVDLDAVYDTWKASGFMISLTYSAKAK